VKRVHIIGPAALAVTGVALTPVALAAAGPGAHAAKATVSVTAKEFKFTLKPTSAKHGSVSFNIKNAGKVDHDFKIAGKKTSKIAKGKSATLTVNLKKGSYQYVCTLPGHAASGMKGNFKVS
jgi:uncharacterized cupredoxin-like copper-binding protein